MLMRATDVPRARPHRAAASRRATSASSTGARRILMLAFEDVQALDVTGPLEVFGRAARCLIDSGKCSTPPYRVEIAARAAGPMTTSSGFKLVADHSYEALGPDVDTLLVAGGRGARSAAADTELLACIRRLAPRVRRLGSVCTGAFVLAAAGVLDGRRATTHWAACDELARCFPAIDVQVDPIFVRDGHVYTSAGVTAGMDLALALVDEDYGPQVALQVARQLVMFVRRPGGQSQFSAQLAVQAADRRPLRDLQGWMADHLGEDLSVAALAARVAMSPRNFARLFSTSVGMTPAAFVERLRVDAARRRLEESSDDVETIARGCGFGTAARMRRSFVRQLHVSPLEYRNRSRRTENVGRRT